MNTVINTAILSYGMSGRVFHAPFISTNPDFKLVAVTERHSKNVRKKYPEVKSYDSVEELLEDPSIELVIINTPNNTHYEYAKMALQAGKHVLVEKPFAASSAEAADLFETGRKNNCKVMAYHNRRWDSDFQSVKRIIEAGTLGNLIEVHFRFDRYKREISPKWFKEEPLPASGLTYDLGSHLVDQAISLFGKPLTVHKSAASFREASRVDDFVHILLKYPGDLHVFITSSLLVANPLPAFVLHGTRGTFIKERTDVQESQLDSGKSPLDDGYGVEPDGSEGQLTIIGDDGTRKIEYVTSLRSNYNHLFNAVYACVRQNQPYPITEEEVIWQMEILEKDTD